MTVPRQRGEAETICFVSNFSPEVGHAFALGLAGCDVPEWLPFLSPEELGMPPGSKLTLSFERRS